MPLLRRNKRRSVAIPPMDYSGMTSPAKRRRHHRHSFADSEFPGAEFRLNDEEESVSSQESSEMKIQDRDSEMQDSNAQQETIQRGNRRTSTSSSLRFETATPRRSSRLSGAPTEPSEMTLHDFDTEIEEPTVLHETIQRGNRRTSTSSSLRNETTSPRRSSRLSGVPTEPSEMTLHDFDTEIEEPTVLHETIQRGNRRTSTSSSIRNETISPRRSSRLSGVPAEPENDVILTRSAPQRRTRERETTQVTIPSTTVKASRSREESPSLSPLLLSISPMPRRNQQAQSSNLSTSSPRVETVNAKVSPTRKEPVTKSSPPRQVAESNPDKHHTLLQPLFIQNVLMLVVLVISLVSCMIYLPDVVEVRAPTPSVDEMYNLRMTAEASHRQMLQTSFAQVKLEWQSRQKEHIQRLEDLDQRLIKLIEKRVPQEITLEDLLIKVNETHSDVAANLSAPQPSRTVKVNRRVNWDTEPLERDLRDIAQRTAALVEAQTLAYEEAELNNLESPRKKPSQQAHVETIVDQEADDTIYRELIHDRLVKYDSDILARRDFSQPVLNLNIPDSTDQLRPYHPACVNLTKNALRALCYSINEVPDRSIIFTPASPPRRCLPFEGGSGSIVAWFRDGAAPIRSFAMEQYISLTTEAETPKEIKLYGLNKREAGETLLAKLFYDLSGSPIQEANAANIRRTATFDGFRVEFVNNHGNSKQSCVHRIRIL